MFLENVAIFIFAIYLLITGLSIFNGRKAKNLDNHFLSRYIKIRNKSQFIKLMGIELICVAIVSLLINFGLLFKSNYLMYIGTYLFIAMPILFLIFIIMSIRFK